MLPLVVLAVAFGAAPDDAVPFDAKMLRRIFQHSPLPAPPANETNRYAEDAAAAALGRQLFFDARLSADGTISCATCHDQARGFTDGLPVTKGLAEGSRNTLSLWNSAYHRWQYWDGSRTPPISR